MSPTAFSADIIARVVHAEKPMPRAMAENVLDWSFGPSDLARMSELARRNSEGELSDAERAELEEYTRVGHFVALIQSNARRSLRMPATA